MTRPGTNPGRARVEVETVQAAGFSCRSSRISPTSCITRVRYGKGKDIYALELERSGQSIVFRNIPPWEFSEGEAAVYCWNGWESQGWFGRAYLQPARARIVTADGSRHDLDPVNVVRIGKVIGKWPAKSDRPLTHTG
jgi:hypothetical protein